MQTGGASGTLNNVAPSSTSGVPVISQGASSQPIFGTAVVAGGGTGDTSFTAYAPVCGGTTTTAALQSASTGISTSGYVLTSNGASSLPTFQAGTGFTSLNVQKFTTSGTYTPTTNMLYCTVEVVGGGGGGGGSVSGATYPSTGGGGGAGGYSRKTISSSTIGTSQTVTIGAFGAGGASGANNGASGGTTSLGSLISASGGSGGVQGTNNNGVMSPGGVGGVGSSGDLNANGAPGGNGILYTVVASYFSAFGGVGGSSIYGGGALAIGANAGGNAATNYASGGGGGACVAGSGNQAGGNGSAGFIIITEYVWSVPASLPVWSDQSSNFNAAGGNGYFVTGTVTATRPSSPSEGATIMFAVDSTSVLTITANTGQYIRLGTAISASAGTCANNARGDSIELVFRSSDSVWLAVPGTQGIWTVT